MVKKSNLFFVLFFVLLVGVLVGCSGGNQVSSPDSESGEGSSQEEQVTIRIGSVNSDQHTLYQGYKKFQEIVQEETDGKIKVEIYPNGQLGNDQSMLEGLKLGVLEAVGVSTSMLANWSTPMLAYDLPFAFPNKEVAYKVLDGPFGQKMGDLLAEEGLVLLAYFENGFRNLTTKNKEVTSVDDLKGLKIRIMETPLQLDTWNTLGANATPMAYTELFTGMQQGVIDGQENPLGNIAMDKFYEVQKYLIETNHVYNPMGLVISKEFLEKLSAEDRKIIKEAAVKAGNYQRQLNSDRNDEFKQILVDNGMEFIQLSPEGYNSFVDKVQVVYEKYREIIGEEYVEEFLAELQKHSN